MPMRIQTTKGQSVLVDDEDFAWLSQFSWSAHRKGYAVRYGYDAAGKYHQFWMHREILRAPEDKIVDHINGDPSDNRRANLRLATDAENSRNRRNLGSPSGFLGVIKHGSKWRAYITRSGVQQSLGYHATREAAIAARSAGAKVVFGEFAPELRRAA